MLFWLLNMYADEISRWQSTSPGETRVYLTARTALATFSSFLVAIFYGPFAIRWLKSNFQERIDSASARLNELHSSKKSTPTMGGLFIVVAIVVAALLCGDLSNRYLQLALVTVVLFGAIGAIDDWVKNRTSRRGLTARQKFAAQCIASMLVLFPLYWGLRTAPQLEDLPLNLGLATISLGPAFVLWGSFVMVGSSNGVNLTDGLDGLAGGCLLIAGSAMAALCYLSGHKTMAAYLEMTHVVGAGELCIVFGAMTGAILGFLWFNCHPAMVFMGDTGSLPLGALLAFGALVIRQELLLMMIGGIFVVETLSVMAQVASFKLTGKRVLLCSPLHNHFVFRGDPETRIVVRFWIGAAVLALLAVASLKLR
ncbi:phospho-N-acetylmuramoyl-pentapeptide-transferase [Planctopirus hydrillae]|nr:phospho-N-acetylmuramoyl-pentapeptide-transferase [Planctopirus hydrillae]